MRLRQAGRRSAAWCALKSAARRDSVMGRAELLGHDLLNDQDKYGVIPIVLAGMHDMAGKRHKRSKGNSEVSSQVYGVGPWEEFLDLITDFPYSNWAFRGHCDAAWPLFSALSRYFISFHVHPDAWRTQESRILRIFRRKAHQFLSHIPNADDDFQ